MARRTPRAARPRPLTTLETPKTKDTSAYSRLDAPSAKLGRSLEEEYSHIRGDLMRILILAILILGGMVLLKVIIGL